MQMLCNELNSFFYESSNETSRPWEVIKGAFLDYVEEHKRQKKPLSKILHLTYYQVEDNENLVAKAILNCDVIENVLTFKQVVSCKELAESNGLFAFESTEEDAEEGLFISFVFTSSNSMPGENDFV